MASQVDICNLALAHIGDEANIQSLLESSVAAEKCNVFYPIARDALLEGYAWSFNTRRAALALLDTNPAEGIWAYAYALPSTCIRPLVVLSPGATDETQGEDYVVETLEDGSVALLTNAEHAVLRYLVRVTDTSKYTPLFVTALAMLLASYLAGAIIKGRAGTAVAERLLNRFLRLELPQATSANANVGQQSSIYKSYTPRWLSDR